MENNIRKIRDELGMKQYELAEKTGLSESYISHLEKGTRDNPTKEVMKKIATALHKEVKDIFNI